MLPAALPRLLLVLGALPCASEALSAQYGAPSARALRGLLSALDLPFDSTIADVGAGSGDVGLAMARAYRRRATIWLQDVRDAWGGRAHPERIFGHIEYAVGTPSDTGLPDEQFDLLFVRDAVHEFVEVASMFASMRGDLRPGGFLTVVDRHAGVDRTRTPYAERAERHAFLGEDTLGRLASDSGLRYHAHLELELGREDFFTLVLRRPLEGQAERAPLDPRAFASAWAHVPRAGRLLLVAQPPSRAGLRAALDELGAELALCELWQDEWLLPGESAPPPLVPGSPTHVSFFGVPHPPLPALDGALFVDAFHSAYHREVLLACLRERLAPGAPLVIVERAGAPSAARMQSLLLRQLAPEVLLDALARHGFEIVHAPEGELAESAPFALVARRAEREASPLLTESDWVRTLLALKERGGSLRELCLLGDDPNLTPALDAADLWLGEHSSWANWSAEPQPWRGETEERVRTPYPQLLERRPDARLVLVVDYDRHPEPQALWGERRCYALVRPRGARLDGRFDRADQLEAALPEHRLERLPLEESGAELWLLVPR